MTTKIAKTPVFLIFIFFWLQSFITLGQKSVLGIETAKLIKTDPKLVTISGYLIVPENRKFPDGNKVKIPFVFVRRADQSPTKNISIYTTGGPGYSTVAGIDSIGYNSGFLKYGGFIAFDQRGTKKAFPCLDCTEVEKALQTSYRDGKNRDSLVRLAH